MFSPYASMKRRLKVDDEAVVLKAIPESEGMRDMRDDIDKLFKLISESLGLNRMTKTGLEVSHKVAGPPLL